MDLIKIPTTFSEKAERLVHQVHQWHHPQQRKYTKLPYSTHLIRVAQLIQLHTQEEGLIAAALCHDLLEDTPITKSELEAMLTDMGYATREVQSIIKWVIELTDVYVKTNFPQKNRKERKALELKRLLQISPSAASVKFADLIDNLRGIVPYDRGFAKVYLRETLPLLQLACPYPSLHFLAKQSYAAALKQLNLQLNHL